MNTKAVALAAIFGIGLTGVTFHAEAAPNNVIAPSKTEVAGLRRLTESEYRNSIADIFGSNIRVEGRFEPGRRVGGLLSASSAILSVTPAGFEAYSKMADSIAAQVVDEKNRAKLVPCKPKSASAPDDVCAIRFLTQYGFLLFRRPLTPEEISRRVALADDMTKSSGSFYTGLRYSLATLMSAPDFLFRTEIAVPGEGKNYTLEPYSRASRLSYLIWNSTPDSQLLQAAQTGELNTTAGVTKEVDRLMASPRLKVGMRAFFSDLFQLDNFSNTTKDGVIYPEWSDQVAASAQEETLRTAIDLTLTSNGDIRDLMTTRNTFMDRTLASIYDVQFNFKGDWEPYSFPESAGRSGLLTQVSLLGMFSHPGRSSPTERGVAILDILMCQPSPLPPPTVDLSAIDNNTDPNLKTVRQRLMAHATNPTCASCHRRTDPLGLSLEQFNSVGARRDRDNGELIDVSSAIGTEKFSGAVGLGKVLHNDPKFPACFARKLYSYGTGANTDDVKPAMFSAAFKTFTDDGYRLRTLLRAMATSPEFFSAPPPVDAAKPVTKAAN
jgi:hypothetical protein